MNIVKSASEEIHEMFAEYNEPERVFYYTENEVRELCYRALNLSPNAVFDEWFDNVKKK